MNEIRVGGPYTCPDCGHWSDGSDVHVCGEREKEIRESVANSPMVKAIKNAHAKGYADAIADAARVVESFASDIHMEMTDAAEIATAIRTLSPATTAVKEEK